MKRIFVSMAFLCLSLWAFSEEVPSSRALSVARQFMGTDGLSLSWDGSEAATRAVGEAPSFYVFNVSGGGWVIVSAEDSTVPILAYSETGSFRVEGMPGNLRSWFDAMRGDIRRARLEGLRPSLEVQALWENPRRPETRAGSSDKVVLETAEWSQESPYNNYLSTYVTSSSGSGHGHGPGGSSSSGVSGLYTGCVATAMAIVLHYHQWPVKGTGTIGGYSTATKGYTVAEINISEHEYDWDNMLSSYGNSATSEQKNAVALLMLDCGVMVEMDYTTSGSGAYSENMVPALTEHMQYSKAAQLRYRMDYSYEEWMTMIKYEIDHNGPLLYSGVTDDNEGHQFVCDGYDLDNDKVHINWGWGGSDNGYFTLTLETSYTFDLYQSAVFGLVPDEDESSVDAGFVLEMAYDTDCGYPGVSLQSGTVATGETFVLDAGLIYNPSGQEYTGAVKAVLVDKDGNWKEDVSATYDWADLPFPTADDYKEYEGQIDLVELMDVECSITEDIALGDRIAIWYDCAGTWTPVGVDHEDLTCPETWACVDACFIKVNDSYAAGDRFYFSLIPGNTGISAISWTFDGTSCDPLSSVALTSGTHTVRAEVSFTDNTSETITQTIVVE